VNVDGSFSYEINQATTNAMHSGQYFVVVQHPGMNGIYDINWAGAPAPYVYDYGLGGTTGYAVFKIYGSGSLQGSVAAEALTIAIYQPYIDDTSINLQFQIVSSSKIGVYKDGAWYLDNDGSGTWNTGDKVYSFGLPTWSSVVGDWNGDGKTEIGIYKDGMWYLDTNGDGVFNTGDSVYSFGLQGWSPVLGDWNGDGKTEIGVYKDGVWYLDMNGDGIFDTGDSVYSFGLLGWTSVVGKWS